ncbi:ORF-150 [Teiidae poxvirus 1]|nr:ORF-150 [Teiidae poxvirus 1]
MSHAEVYKFIYYASKTYGINFDSALSLWTNKFTDANSVSVCKFIFLISEENGIAIESLLKLWCDNNNDIFTYCAYCGCSQLTSNVDVFDCIWCFKYVGPSQCF